MPTPDRHACRELVIDHQEALRRLAERAAPRPPGQREENRERWFTLAVLGAPPQPPADRDGLGVRRGPAPGA